MKLDKHTREMLRAHCGEIHDDDAVDPRDCSRKSTRGHKESRKAKQLCRQVAETLDYVLSGDCRDETLQSLQVLSVDPAPNASRLLVTVRADLPDDQFDRQSILESLAGQTGRLRCEVAASINRKRVPALVFNVVGAPGIGVACG
jgi:ribosome-binding factor A